MEHILEQSGRLLNGASRVETKEQKEAREEQRKRDLADLRKIIDTPEGRRFFTRFFSVGRIHQSSMAEGNWIYFNEGWRNLALRFYDEVKVARPDLFNHLGGFVSVTHVATPDSSVKTEPSKNLSQIFLPHKWMARLKRMAAGLVARLAP